MLKEGHTGISLIVIAPISAFLVSVGLYLPAVFATVAAIIGGGIPDFDTRVWFVKHRGATHTVWFGCLFGLLAMIAGYLISVSLYSQVPFSQEFLSSVDLLVISIAAGVGGLVGVLGHLLGDILTPRGLSPFSPVSSQKLSLDFVKASNRSANSMILALGMILFALSHYVGFQQSGFVSQTVVMLIGVS